VSAPRVTTEITTDSLRQRELDLLGHFLVGAMYGRRPFLGTDPSNDTPDGSSVLLDGFYGDPPIGSHS
jgi:hypothetical protein